MGIKREWERERMIENIKREDLNEMVNIYIDAFNNEPWNDQWTNKTARERLNNMINDSGFYGIKIKRGNDICGFILGHEEVFYDRKIFNIKEFCTNRKYQGNGYGKKLILEMEKKIKGKGIEKIMLMTIRDIKAEGFYLRRGYQTYEELVIMGKEIL